MPYAHSGPNWVEITGDPATWVIPGKGTKKAGVVDPVMGLIGYVDQPDELITTGPAWAETQTPAFRAQIGLKLILDPDPAPVGTKTTGRTVVDAAGSPKYQLTTAALTFAEKQAAKLVDLDTLAQGKIANGYPCNLGPAPGTAETLQLRDEKDRTNWLTLRSLADDGIAAGQGAAICTSKVRCTSNREYAMTNQATADLMKNLRSWGAAMQQNVWNKGDAIKAAATQVQLDAVDITTGWP